MRRSFGEDHSFRAVVVDLCDEDEAEEQPRRGTGAKRRSLPPPLPVAADDVVVLDSDEDEDEDASAHKRAREDRREDRQRSGEESSAGTDMIMASMRAQNSLLAQLHAERVARRGPPPSSSMASSGAAAMTTAFKLLTYNVWFNESAALHARIDAIGRVVEQERPNAVMLQEVTPNILRIMRRAGWYSRYHCSVDHPTCAETAEQPYFVVLLSDQPLEGLARTPFRTSIMGRELVTARFLGGALTAGTTHLESPCPPEMNVHERRQQLETSVAQLEKATTPSVLLAGDFNWSERRWGSQASDGEMPLPESWADAWPALHGSSDAGHTYDAKANAMLTGSLKGRLDRCVCRLRGGWELEEARLVGKEPLCDRGSNLPVTYTRMGRSGPQTLPVCPSDHFGLVVQLKRRSVA
mmetsp:Transcript_1158/g.4317  ORF Transcript_1158/g.4317 Transcript_1158/m.4317 type:complete len:410 (+) Transcript_1158:3-1232(+)